MGDMKVSTEEPTKSLVSCTSGSCTDPLGSHIMDYVVVLSMPLPQRSVEITENLSQDSWCMSWDWNQTSTNYKSSGAPQHQCSVHGVITRISVAVLTALLRIW